MSDDNQSKGVCGWECKWSVWMGVYMKCVYGLGPVGLAELVRVENIGVATNETRFLKIVTHWKMKRCNFGYA